LKAQPLLALLSETIRTCVHPDAQITQTTEAPLSQFGFSGAELQRYDICCSAGQKPAKTASLLVKDASLVERQALTTLFQQGHAVIPYCFAPDLVTDHAAPICMEYIQPDAAEPGLAFMRRTAEGLADLHFRNLGQRQLLCWAPPADQSYFTGGYVLDTWRTSWNKHMADPEFAFEYRQYQLPLESAAASLLREMDELWQEGETLTLIHGDLHAGNFLAKNGNPYFIDWGHAHYGSFYLDLPNLFSREVIPAYYDRLASLGLKIPPEVFFERYRQAGRHIGFKYMAFTMSGWEERNKSDSKFKFHMQNLIHLALNGA
jgi:fructosamine-3-kinase